MKRPRRTSILALLGIAGAGAIGIPLVASAGPGSLPDLVSEAPANEYLEPYSDGRLLLRFDGYVTNSAGASSALEIRARNDVGGVMQTVEQWGGSSGAGVGGINVGQGPGGKATVVYETADGHVHYHLKDAAEYTLWDEAKITQVALAQKTEAGFCLEDTISNGGGPAVYDVGQTNFCRTGNPLVMGISPGWKDEYHDRLSYQWIDATNVQPGRYFLAGRVDPRGVIAESDKSNNGYAYKSAATTIPGFVAKEVTTAQTGAPTVVGLDATQIGSPSGSRKFKILSTPAHGTLNAPIGSIVSSSVTYSPKPGYLGSDSFSYAAITDGYAYPVQPAAAAAILAGTTVSVAISGAPAGLSAGTSAQLSANVVNAPAGVTWSASAGTITPSGLYVAPSSTPAGGSVTIRATSIESPEVSASVTIAISDPAPAAPAPGRTTGILTAGTKLISPVRVINLGPRIIVSKVAIGARAGRVVFTATIGRKVLGRCVVKRVGARKSVTCKITLKKSYALKKVRVTAKFTAVNGATAVRRSFVIR